MLAKHHQESKRANAVKGRIKGAISRPGVDGVSSNREKLCALRLRHLAAYGIALF